ncbi:MAG: methyltransferase domain-containing protein [Bacteroidota bacterium]
MVDTKYRSDAQEIMDDFDYNGEILHDSLDKLSKINRWLGGHRVTLNGLKKLLKHHPKKEPLTIVDLGCGSGDILREVAEFGKKKGYKFQLLGIDANENTVAYAERLSKGYPNIEYRQMDIFSEAFGRIEFDVVLATLFFHHFKEDELLKFLKPVVDRANLGVVVNDIHRHRMAYYLFKLLSLTISNQTIVEDGLTSVLRGFKKKELIKISQELHMDFKIKWKWAFRYQWILKQSKSINTDLNSLLY